VLKRIARWILIPRGMYCYRKGYLCPFWFRDSGKPSQENGYCSFLEDGDELSFSLLWDQVKECGRKT